MTARTGMAVTWLFATCYGLLLAYWLPFLVIDAREGGGPSPFARSTHQMMTLPAYRARYLELAAQHPPLLAAHGAARFVQYGGHLDALGQPLALHAEPERGILALVAPGWHGVGGMFRRVPAARAGVRVLVFLDDHEGDLDHDRGATAAFVPGACLAHVVAPDRLAQYRWRPIRDHRPLPPGSVPPPPGPLGPLGEEDPSGQDIFEAFGPASRAAFAQWDQKAAYRALSVRRDSDSPTRRVGLGGR